MKIQELQKLTDAIAWTLTERQERISRPLRLFLGRKAVWIENGRVRVVFRVVLNCISRNENHLPLFDDKLCAFDLVISRADASQI